MSREKVRYRDWSNELKGKAYAVARRGATPKSIRIGDAVLLKAEKSNKLSTNFRFRLTSVRVLSKWFRRLEQR